MPLEAVLALVSSHVPEPHVEEVEDTLEECGGYATRLQKRASRKKAFGALLPLG